MMKQKISFYTLGCRLNQSETAGITNSFEVKGYDVVDFDQPSDIAVINTCTVTENGDADTRRLVNKVNRVNPQAKIALIGCQSQVQKEKLTKLPNVRWVVGNERKMDLVNVLEEYSDVTHPQVITPTIERKSFIQDIASIDRTHTRANLKIQDGCDFFCSFCEIPYARGRARSREFNNILDEAKILVDAGHQEIVLTGINIGTYDFGNKSFLDVVEALEKITGLERIRISSIEPTTIPRELFDYMRDSRKLCRYLHIPLQAGDDQVLGKMKRKYSVAEFADFIQWVYEAVPEVCIGTDVIVGFPGEKDGHFFRTEKFLRESSIHYFHVFSYSARYMAKSRDLGEPVSTTKIQERSQILRNLSSRKRRVFYNSMLKTTQKVLFEQKKGDFWQGLTDNYLKVKIKNSSDLANQLKYVTLTSVEENAILGQLLP